MDVPDDTRGFGGLSSLLSDREGLLTATRESTADSSDSARSTDSGAEPSSTSDEAQRGERRAASQPVRSTRDSTSGKWVLFVLACMGVVGLIELQDKDLPSSGRTGPTPARTASAPFANPPKLAQPSAPVAEVYPSVPKAPVRLAEIPPPVGIDLVLPAAQIRYCLVEDIRLDAAQFVIRNHVAADVDAFNGMIDDYNSRCGSFRYRSSTLESARRQIEPFRRDIQIEGRRRFTGVP